MIKKSLFLTAVLLLGLSSSRLPAQSATEAAAGALEVIARRYTRTETRGDGPSRTLNYPVASASFVWTDFKNRPFTDTPITTAPGGWQITDPRNNTTTYDLEPVLDRMLAAKRRTSAAVPLSPL